MHFGYNTFYDMNGCTGTSTSTVAAFITEAVEDLGWTLVGLPTINELHTDTDDGGFIYVQLLDRGYVIVQSRNLTNQIYLDIWTPTQLVSHTLQFLVKKHFNFTVRAINNRLRLAPMMDNE